MTPAIIFGFGNLGRALVRAIEATGHIDIVAVVDTAPGLIGRRVADLLPGSRCGAMIVADLPENTAGTPTILFHATTSAPAIVTKQVLAAIAAGYSVISAAEWLFHPWLRYGAEAKAFDEAARARGTHVLGCGVNPGFCFETLPILLSRTLSEVRSLNIMRVSNVSGIGPSDFAHVGLGLTESDFAARVLDGSIDGHMGFPESIAALAECLGIPIDAITDHLVPTLATHPIVLSHRTVAVGEICGITQTATGSVDGVPVIIMRLDMFLEPEFHGLSPQEAVTVEGSRNFAVTIKPGAPAVDGAAAMMVHASAALGNCAPGLRSLLDLPMSGGRLSRSLLASPAVHSPKGSSFTVS